ncbi:hypothetical protein TNCV_2759121 [Trichonephila clavipes]|nr:hypothetical protein TNCV_2759121 [Trichonephila clavipes]
MEQLKTLNEIIPTLRSKKTGTLIKLYTNNSHDYELLQDSVEKLKYQFFTIKPKHERPIKVVVKGLPKNTETRDIHQNLIELRIYRRQGYPTRWENNKTTTTSFPY